MLDSLLGIGNITSGAVSALAFGITYILAWIFGAFISIEAWLIGVVLNINSGIMQTSFVQTGFSISLSVANLAFVLGIIVIALATILRIENYSIKKMLWKLVVMAILVNFGLVIMAPIVGFSNTLTQYFLNCIDPAAGGCSQTASGVEGFNNFAKAMSGKFNPGAMFAPVANPTQGSANTLAPFGLPAVGTVPLGATLVPIFSLILTVFDFILIVFVLGAFIVMLMIRYIYLAILAILLPFAWASWVFPSFSSMYSKWWNKFLQWTFFAPIFMFFVYLALATIGGSNNADALNNTDYLSSGNTLFQPIIGFFGSQIQPIISNLLQEMVLAGLIIGGLIAADSMGVKFAGAAVKVAQNGAKSARNATWNATKRRTTDRMRTMGKKTTTNAAGKAETTTLLQRFGSRLQGVPVPFAKTLGSAVAKQGSQEAFHEERAEDIKKYVTANLKGLDNEGLIARANSATAFINPTEAGAIAQELAKRDLMTSVNPRTGRPNIDPSRVQRFINNTERMGNIQSILNNRPELAAQTSAAAPRFDATLGRIETAAEAVARAISDATKKIKTADITDINYKSLGDPTGAAMITREQQVIALAMSTGQLRKLVTDGSDNQTKAYKDTIKRMHLAATIAAARGAAPMPPQLDKLHTYVTTNPEWIAV